MMLLLTLLLANHSGFQACVESSLFQCQISSEINGLVYTPNIPNFYFNHTNAAALRNVNLTISPNRIRHIFTIPAVSTERNCSGPVVALQYCYRARQFDIGQEYNIFHIITLYRDGQNLIVVDRFPVHVTPREDTCTASSSLWIICCTTQNVINYNESQFQLPASNFTFGVVNTKSGNSNLRILTFIQSITEFGVEQFVLRRGQIELTPGDVLFPERDLNLQQNRALLLLRFYIDDSLSLSLTTELPLTEDHTFLSTEAPLLTSEADDSPSPSTKLPLTKDEGMRTPEESSAKGTAMPGVHSSIMKVTLGASVGAVGSLLLIGIVATIIFMTVKCQRSHKSRKMISASKNEDHYKTVKTKAAYVPTPSVSVEANAAYVTTPSIPVEANTAYVTTPSIPVVEDNAAYAPTPSIPVEANAAYVTTPSSIPMEVYATIPTEEVYYDTPYSRSATKD